MGNELYDLIKHTTWANHVLVEFCQGLDEDMLNTTVPGTYGTVIQTLRHYLDSEMSYLFRLVADENSYPWQKGEQVSLAVLAERVELLATTWDRFLAHIPDLERRVIATGEDPPVYTIPVAIFLLQAIHHGNEHRAHICTILGAHGIEAPEVSAWAYGFASGRAQV